jgi:hypothetical protein
VHLHQPPLHRSGASKEPCPLPSFSGWSRWCAPWLASPSSVTQWRVDFLVPLTEATARVGPRKLIKIPQVFPAGLCALYLESYLNYQKQTMNRQSMPSGRGGPGATILGILRGIGVTLMIFGLFFAGVGMAMYADSMGQPSLDELLLSNQDVPAGYAMNSELSGELTAERARRLGASEWAEIAGNASGWTRVWDRVGTNEQVRILVINTRNQRAAGIANESLARYLRSAGFHSFEVSSIDGAVGAEAERLANSEPVAVAVVGFARGSLTFTISTGPRRTTEAESATTLAIELAERQDIRASDRYSASVASTDADYAGLVGGLVGSVGLYALIAFWLAHAGDPVRRRKRQRKGQPQQFPLADTLPHSEGQAFDVRMSAMVLQTRAVPLFVMEVVAGVLVIAAALPISVTVRTVLIGLAGLIFLVTKVLRRRISHRQTRQAVVGRRPVRAAFFYLLAATSLLLAAVMLLLTVAHYDLPGDTQYIWAALLFLATVIVAKKRARQLAALSARKVMTRDPRPPVLYLRCFGDDQLRLRTATLGGRRSFIERLIPRFDFFEEVLTRHLTEYGPVVAINPPGTQLAPIGAARETLPHDSWQATVREWMERAALIVIGAPPGAWTPGLVWELEQVDTCNLWPKTIVVSPPLADDQLRWRWFAFATSGPPNWPFRRGLPADPAILLTLTRRSDGLVAFTADTRTEWSYSAAIAAAATLPR